MICYLVIQGSVRDYHGCAWFIFTSIVLQVFADIAAEIIPIGGCVNVDEIRGSNTK